MAKVFTSKKVAAQYLKDCAKCAEKATRSGMDFRAAHPAGLSEAAALALTGRIDVPKYAKIFAYSEMGGDWEYGYLPEEAEKLCEMLASQYDK